MNKYTMIFDDDLQNIIYNGDGETLMEALKIVLEYHKTGERPHGHTAGLAQYIANNLINNEERAKQEAKREADRQRAYDKRHPEQAQTSEQSDNVANVANVANVTENRTYNNNNNNKDKDNNYNITITKENNAHACEVVAVSLEEIDSYFSERGWEDYSGQFYDLCTRRGWENIKSWKCYAETVVPKWRLGVKKSSFDADEFFEVAKFKGFNENKRPSYDIGEYEKESIEKVKKSSFDAEEFFNAAVNRGINNGEENK